MMFLFAKHSAGLLSKNFVKQSFTKFLESQLHGSRRKSYLSVRFFFSFTLRMTCERTLIHARSTLWTALQNLLKGFHRHRLVIVVTLQFITARFDQKICNLLCLNTFTLSFLLAVKDILKYHRHFMPFLLYIWLMICSRSSQYFPASSNFPACNANEIRFSNSFFFCSSSR